MTKELYQEGKWRFVFIPEYADCIARMSSSWARLEYDINASIWLLADMRPALGACVTSQIYTINGRLSALLSLAKLRGLDAKILKKINKFCEEVRAGQTIRNRVMHDMWLLDKSHPEQMGQLRVTAEKTLHFKIEPIMFLDLVADFEKLDGLQTTFYKIRQSIDAALPSLPKMSETELYPITETPLGS
jgi:hypothetical protein